MSGLQLDTLRQVNIERCENFFGHKLVEWSETDRACTVAGEVGEMCNLIKKRHRGEEIPSEDVGKEIADAVVYLDLLASRLGFKLEELIVQKFNEVSTRKGIQDGRYYL